MPKNPKIYRHRPYALWYVVKWKWYDAMHGYTEAAWLSVYIKRTSLVCINSLWYVYSACVPLDDLYAENMCVNC